MDHMLELARHADLLEAIDLTAAHPSATDLKRVSFLATEHANTWIIEVVQAFYAHPDFAADVWVNLRYCVQFEALLIERALAKGTSRRPIWARRNAGNRVLAESELALFKTKPRDAVQQCLSRVAADKTNIDTLCRDLQLIPEPPAFLNDILRAEGVSAAADRDKRTQVLLAHPDEIRKAAHDRHLAVPFSIVQEGELRQICQTRLEVRPATMGLETGRLRAISDELLVDDPARAYRRHSARTALDMDLVGLAFSGGGIRSATFNLGVLQALSKIGLLKQIDYLSTVSGGGYIGSWFGGWICRELEERQQQPVTPGASSTQRRTGAEIMTDIQRRLSPTRSPNPMDASVRPIRFLREYSNYLTPRTGVFSADTWTMIGIYVRNALLNQVIIVSFFAAALLMPRNWSALAGVLGGRTWTGYLAIALWVCGGIFLTLNLQRLDPRAADAIAEGTSEARPDDRGAPPWFAHPRNIHRLVILPWLVAAALVARIGGTWAVTPSSIDFAVASAPLAGIVARIGAKWALAANTIHFAIASVSLAAVVAVSIFTILLAGRADRCWTTSGKGPKRGAEAFATIALSAIVAGVVVGGLVWALVAVLTVSFDSYQTVWNLDTFGTPGLLSALSLAIVAMLGMLGEEFPDEHREWWSRLRTVIHIYAVTWLAWFVASAYVPWGLHALTQKGGLLSGVGALAAWIASTVFGVVRGSEAEADTKAHAETTAQRSASSRLFAYAAAAAPYVFVVGLVVAISLGIDAVFTRVAPERVRTALTFGAYWQYAQWTTSTCWSWTLACLGIGLLFSWRVDINEFSIHHFYKNRLVRCYLGASRTNRRKPDWFTGFDPSDDLPLKQFDDAAADDKPRYPGPYPIVNCALNLVGGRDLAWQERKATSFVFTPKYCGYDIDRAVLTKHRGMKASEAYRPTTHYYRADEGPLLGTAMAISGAAANPNMGRATSPALAFLMTVFNVRLGWWIGNPRDDRTAVMPGPRLGLAYTALELFGATDDSRCFVNLSDGGHFDNLGVYQLIRRNCRYVVVCDAGHDDRFICEDLGDLVRKCRTDFGVEIDIAVDRIRERNSAGDSQSHCVVGKIHYLNLPRRVNGQLVDEDGGPLLPGSAPAHEEGYLVYIKPSITGDEPQDVLEYHRRVPQFPHQSTADQWFNESQFESYRKLGMHIGEETFSRYQSDDTQCVGNMQQFFEKLYRYWYPPSLVSGGRSTEDATEYSRIMEMVRNDSTLKRLDHTLFEQLTTDNGAPQLDERDEFYVCNALIQLIENVYVDVDLEHNWNHPHVQGWMKVFVRWAQQPSFRRTWKISESTYAERFRNFYNDRLRGRALTFPKGFVASHRGRVNGGEPGCGNTMTDFNAAIEAGASVIELDVQRLASGELIVYHDESIDGIQVTKCRLDDLKQRGMAVLQLADCLRDLRGRVRLDLELKVAGVEKLVLETMREQCWRYRDFVLTSFDRRMATAARAICSDVRLGLLVDKRCDYDSAFAEFLLLDADFLAPEATLLDLTQDLAQAKDARVPLVPWTVNEEDQLHALLTHDAVAGVITDNVLAAVRVRSQL